LTNNASDTDNAIKERLRITRKWRVGIWTLAPSSELEVVGTVTATQWNFGWSLDVKIYNNVIAFNRSDNLSYILQEWNNGSILIRTKTTAWSEVNSIRIYSTIVIFWVPIEAKEWIILNELSSDPADPAEWKSIQRQSDGTGAWDDGDIMMKITAWGVTKTTTLVDFSTL
jgi:hypothetical protein